MTEIIAMGGGGFSMEDTPLLDDFVLGRARASQPRVLFVPTASGDSGDYIQRFYAAFGPHCRADHVELFHRDGADLRARVLAADVVYVGGGNTLNMLAVWRAHGFDHILREAYASGVVLAGVSAGAVCWFEATVTDSYGPLAALRDGLGVLPGVCVPHYDSEAERRPTLHRLLLDGTYTGALAIEDSAAAVFRDGQLAEIVASRPGPSAFRVACHDGRVTETRLDARYLGA